MIVLLPAIGFLEVLVLVFVVGTITGGVFFGIYMLMFPKRSAADRLASLTDGPTEDEKREDDDEGGFVEQFALRIGEMAADAMGGDDEEEIRDALKVAGYRDFRAYEVLQGSRVVGLFLGPTVLSALAMFLSTQAALLAMLLGAAAGYYLPKLYIQNKADARMAAITEGFPDALDLLVSCVEAGMGMDQAFRRVANELIHINPELAREFLMVNAEVSAGVERATALKHLEERTGIDDVRALVNMLVQADRYGTSVAEALRIFSQVAREKRVARAEEAAGQVGGKVTIVMIVFFLPVLFVLLIAPSVIRTMGWE